MSYDAIPLHMVKYYIVWCGMDTHYHKYIAHNQIYYTMQNDAVLFHTMLKIWCYTVLFNTKSFQFCIQCYMMLYYDI